MSDEICHFKEKKIIEQEVVGFRQQADELFEKAAKTSNIALVHAGVGINKQIKVKDNEILKLSKTIRDLEDKATQVHT